MTDLIIAILCRQKPVLQILPPLRDLQIVWVGAAVQRDVIYFLLFLLRLGDVLRRLLRYSGATVWQVGLLPHKSLLHCGHIRLEFCARLRRHFLKIELL